MNEKAKEKARIFKKLNFMEGQLTCAKKVSQFGDAVMCPCASGVKLDNKNNPYWMCNIFNVKLTEDENSWLKRCDKCISCENKLKEKN
jgi:hypothetical protein